MMKRDKIIYSVILATSILVLTFKTPIKSLADSNSKNSYFEMEEDQKYAKDNLAVLEVYDECGNVNYYILNTSKESLDNNYNLISNDTIIKKGPEITYSGVFNENLIYKNSKSEVLTNIGSKEMKAIKCDEVIIKDNLVIKSSYKVINNEIVDISNESMINGNLTNLNFAIHSITDYLEEKDTYLNSELEELENTLNKQYSRILNI